MRKGYIVQHCQQNGDSAGEIHMLDRSQAHAITAIIAVSAITSIVSMIIAPTVNTSQYVTEIFELYLVQFIYSFPRRPEDYQTIEDGLRVHTVTLCQETVKHMALHAWICRLVPPTSTQLIMSGLYLKPACGDYDGILPNVLIQRGNLFKLLKRSWRSLIGLLLIDQLTA
jgi:hypothetical protein